jgi:proline iminopeptidase
MKRFVRYFSLLSVCVLFSCQQKKTNAYYETTGSGIQSGGIRMIPVETPAGKFNVWTKRVGNNPTIKVLLLHGGPACTHEYFECMESFFPKENIEFYYYDQLGSYYSDQPADTSLWQLDRFVDELEQVRKALGLNKDNFYLLGHSWGGILAMQYALKYQDNIKGLVISNMMASCPKYGQYADEVLAKQMDPIALDSIRMLEAKGEFNNPRYMGLLYTHHYEKHICRMPADAWPDPVKRTFKHLNPVIYTQMQGPSEFGIAGNLANWDVSDQLKNITAPTLVIGAKYDSMDPEFMKWMSAQFPNGSYLYCANGSHFCMYDDQQTYFNGLIKFIRAIDRGEKKVSL